MSVIGKILVTGATGTVGSELVKRLSEKGAHVKACCHTIEKAENIKKPNVEIVEIDYSRPETLDNAFQDVEKLFLLTPVVENMVEITKQLTEQAKKSGVRYIVKLSAFQADTKSEVRILKWHHEAEKVIEESGIPYTFLRPNYFMQNFLMLSPMIKAQGTLYLPYAESRISAIDIRDVGEIAAKILTEEGHEGKTYSITGCEQISGNEAAMRFSESLGKEVKYVPVSDEDAKKGMIEMGLPEWLVELLLDFARGIRKELLSPVTNTFEELAGRKPATFSQFVNDYSAMFK